MLSTERRNGKALCRDRFMIRLHLQPDALAKGRKSFTLSLQINQQQVLRERKRIYPTCCLCSFTIMAVLLRVFQKLRLSRTAWSVTNQDKAAPCHSQNVLWELGSALAYKEGAHLRRRNWNGEGDEDELHRAPDPRSVHPCPEQAEQGPYQAVHRHKALFRRAATCLPLQVEASSSLPPQVEASSSLPLQVEAPSPPLMDHT